MSLTLWLTTVCSVPEEEISNNPLLSPGTCAENEPEADIIQFSWHLAVRSRANGARAWLKVQKVMCTCKVTFSRKRKWVKIYYTQNHSFALGDDAMRWCLLPGSKFAMSTISLQYGGLSIAPGRVTMAWKRFLYTWNKDWHIKQGNSTASCTTWLHG